MVDIMIPAGDELNCTVQKEKGKNNYSCTFPNGKNEIIDVITMWYPEVVSIGETADDSIRIRTDKDMKCNFTPRRGGLRSDILCIHYR